MVSEDKVPKREETGSKASTENFPKTKLIRLVSEKPWTLFSSVVTMIFAVVAVLNIGHTIYLGYLQLALGINQLSLHLEMKKEKSIDRYSISGLLVALFCLIVGAIIIFGNMF